MSIIRERRAHPPPDHMTSCPAEAAQLLYTTRNSAVRSVTRHLDMTFDLHDALDSLYDSFYAIDVSVALL